MGAQINRHHRQAAPNYSRAQLIRDFASELNIGRMRCSGKILDGRIGLDLMLLLHSVFLCLAGASCVRAVEDRP